jgi:hypothetical protein
VVGFGFLDTNLFNVRGTNNSVLVRIRPILLMPLLSCSIMLSIACIFRIAHSWTAGLEALFTPQEAGGWSSLAMPRRYVEEAQIANEGMA